MVGGVLGENVGVGDGLGEIVEGRDGEHDGHAEGAREAGPQLISGRQTRSVVLRLVWHRLMSVRGGRDESLGR